MSYTALYRKWRPMAFGEVRGQDHIVTTLKNQILSERIGHAYLFCGTRGTGKTSIAKIFARAVNCENPQDGSPCNECPSCKSILEGSSMNVVEIDAASNNGVENIREIREQVQYPPTDGRYRVYIIDEVHMLSIGAFNALLKTLEEPPSYVIFILATTEVHKIPITILSRCQRYDFKRISLETIAGRLQELTKAEQIEAEEKALRYVAKAADGSMRDALSLLDQCVAFHYGKLLTYENVLDVLGAVDTTVFSKMFRAVCMGNTRECMEELEELVVQGRELGQFVTDFIWYMRNLLLTQSTEDAEGLLDMSEENLKQLKEDSSLADGNTLMRYIRIFSELSNQIRFAAQKRVLVEVAFIKLTKPAMEANLDSILQRLADLEDQVASGVISVHQSENGYAPVSQQTSRPAEQTASVQAQPAVPPETVSLPAAQLEDLNLIRNEWGKIVREMGMSIRPSFRDTVVEPSGESCLCIVFSNAGNYAIGSRPSVLGDLERRIEEVYGKKLYLKSRLAGAGERLDTIYVSDEELRQNIHMDITIED
ncbi:MAG: DNA polymerase III subunit gamma/tau [Lachnospiraceae bacterium]|jgi:DNA polymerase-3 subunit gamma/tau